MRNTEIETSHTLRMKSISACMYFYIDSSSHPFLRETWKWKRVIPFEWHLFAMDLFLNFNNIDYVSHPLQRKTWK